MIWRIEFDSKAKRVVDKLDAQSSRQIFDFLFNRVSLLEDPRSSGDALKGSELGEVWKYRVGDFRIIVDIKDKLLRILVIRIGNRREVYR